MLQEVTNQVKRAGNNWGGGRPPPLLKEPQHLFHCFALRSSWFALWRFMQLLGPSGMLLDQLRAGPAAVTGYGHDPGLVLRCEQAPQHRWSLLMGLNAQDPCDASVLVRPVNPFLRQRCCCWWIVGAID